MVGFLRQTYFKDDFGECRMRNGVRVNLLQKRLGISCVQIRGELLIKIMLLLVMSHDYAQRGPLTPKSTPASRASVCRRDGLAPDRLGSILTEKV
jgi:hypothetical protein